MIRRRRPVREIHFSFDSFLDVVANVVGIILRLILVAWVAGRSYKPFVPPPPPGPESTLAEPTDPLEPELERQRRELAQAQGHLLAQLQEWEKTRQEEMLTTKELAELTARCQSLEAERTGLVSKSGDQGKTRQTLALSLAEIKARSKKVTEEIEALRKAPSQKQALRYRTPVSAPLQSEELLFECRAGRVTLIDIGALLDQVQRGLREKGEQLRKRWEASEVTAPVGPFRLRYFLERERGLLDGVGSGIDGTVNFRFGMTAWEVEPLRDDRGETVEQALTPGSAFRRVIDPLDPQQTAVTMWVYPDSFPQYRRLRDYMHQRDIVVAGRPLPEGVPIASSRRGTASRGQ
jgi:hypothetical protein